MVLDGEACLVQETENLICSLHLYPYRDVLAVVELELKEDHVGACTAEDSEVVDAHAYKMGDVAMEEEGHGGHTCGHEGLVVACHNPEGAHAAYEGEEGRSGHAVFDDAETAHHVHKVLHLPTYHHCLPVTATESAYLGRYCN